MMYPGEREAEAGDRVRYWLGPYQGIGPEGALGTVLEKIPVRGKGYSFTQHKVRPDGGGHDLYRCQGAIYGFHLEEAHQLWITPGAGLCYNADVYMTEEWQVKSARLELLRGRQRVRKLSGPEGRELRALEAYEAECNRIYMAGKPWSQVTAIAGGTSAQ